MSRIYKAIGLMSGTSMDGIDVSLIETDGHKVFNLSNMPNSFFPYSPENQATIAKALAVAPQEHTHEREKVIADCTDLVTQSHIKAVRQFLEAHNLTAEDIDLIGFHGQTILHQPQNRLTLQLGDGAALAKETQIDVVYDFRSNDVAQGGQGAPLVPIFHKALARSAGLNSNTAIVNIGGVANLTFIRPERDTLYAFDTGPGNALMDDWVKQHTHNPMDKDGLIARSGTVHQGCLDDYLSHPYFAQSGAKSLDRNDFPVQKLEDYHLDLADGAATLCDVTARSIAQSETLLPEPVQRWIITGGGTKNPYLIERLSTLVKGKVHTSEDFGWDSDFMEAQAFGFLAVRHILGLPQTFPNTTGISKPMSGGVLACAP